MGWRYPIFYIFFATKWWVSPSPPPIFSYMLLVLTVAAIDLAATPKVAADPSPPSALSSAARSHQREYEYRADLKANIWATSSRARPTASRQ